MKPSGMACEAPWDRARNPVGPRVSPGPAPPEAAIHELTLSFAAVMGSILRFILPSSNRFSILSGSNPSTLADSNDYSFGPRPLRAPQMMWTTTLSVAWSNE